MKPWSINFVNRESGPFHVATGKISDIPVIYQINNEIDPDDPDNYMHLLQKITIGTEGGHLALEDTHGPVIWYPRLHVPVSMYNDKGHLVNYPVHLNENVCDFLYDEPDSFIRTLREKWPDAIAEDLLKVASMIRGECNSLPSFQKELTVSTLWHDLTQKVGFADLVKGTGHEAVYSIDLVPEKDLIRFANSKNLDISDSGSVAEELIKEITVEDIMGYLKDIKIAVCYSILNLLQVDGQWYLMKEGWCDVAGEDINNNENIIEDAKANCKQLDDLRKKIQRIDLDTSKVIKGSRRKPNGKIVRYSIFYLSPVEYPFVVSKYDSLQRPRKIVHENGALEIEKIIISVPPKMIKKYMYLFKNDSRIEIRKGNSLAISNVLIKGISCDLNKNLMHGAKINLQEGGL